MSAVPVKLWSVMDLVWHRQNSGPCQGLTQCFSFPFCARNIAILLPLKKKKIPRCFQQKFQLQNIIMSLKRSSVFDEQKQIILGSGSNSSGDSSLMTERVWWLRALCWWKVVPTSSCSAGKTITYRVSPRLCLWHVTFASFHKTRGFGSTFLSLSLLQRAPFAHNSQHTKARIWLLYDLTHSMQTAMLSFSNAWSLMTQKSLPFILKHTNLENMHLGKEIDFFLSPKRPYSGKSIFCLLGENHHLVLPVTKSFLYTLVWLEALLWKTLKSLSCKDKVRPFIFISLLHLCTCSNAKHAWHKKKLGLSI